MAGLSHALRNQETSASYIVTTSPMLTVEGVTYYVLVTGTGGNLDGSFSLSVNTAGSPLNYNCSSALEISPHGDVIYGDTSTAIHDNFKTSCGSESLALWYLVQGTGLLMTADTCSNYTKMSTIITVHVGSCDVSPSSDSCIVSDYIYRESCGMGLSTVTWATELGEAWKGQET